MFIFTACQTSNINGVYNCTKEDSNNTEKFIVKNSSWDASDNGIWASKDLAGYSLPFKQDKKDETIFIASVSDGNQTKELFRMEYNAKNKTLNHTNFPIKCTKTKTVNNK